MLEDLQLPSYDNTPVTAQSLLSKALNVTLSEYGNYHLLEIKSLYQALVFIRVSLEPAFIKDESQLKNVYNKLRESPDPVTRRQSDIPMRFLNTLLSRWVVYVSDELATPIETFIYTQAEVLADALTLQAKNHVRMDDVMGDTMDKKEWLQWLCDCPIFILIFNLKYMASDYLEQTRDLVNHYESVKDNSNFIEEG